MRVDAPKETALPVEEIIAKDPTTALYLPHAERLVEDGRLDEAIALCEERRRRPGRGVGDHIVLGRAYLADGQLGLARAEFQSALDLDRENVVALKALGGILAHEGNHAEAASFYQAVCRVDPGDLESQTALHQITSGEFSEVRPADVIVGQGSLTWQPVRLPREEEHLSELALGLRTIERFDAARAESAAAAAPKAPPPPSDLLLERIAPVESPRDERVDANAAGSEPFKAESSAWVADAPIDAAAESRRAPGSAPPEPVAPSAPRDTAISAPADAGPFAPPADAAASTPPAAIGDIVESQPPVETPRLEPGKVVEGNKSAFETWLRQLSGRG